MEYRELGRTGWKVSPISIGTWAMGGAWGPTDAQQSMAALHRALDLGVNLFDTADVYGSERLLARLRRERSTPFYVATKIGVRLRPDPRNFRDRSLVASQVEACLRSLDTDALDLVQLHSPPSAVYADPQVFAVLDALVREGKVRHYGVSVETVEEALTAIQHPNVQSVQMVFNLFRHRPAEDLLPEARRRRVGVLARVPLASGLLTGKMSRRTTFHPEDHRHFNRRGEAFDIGETFSGVSFDEGLKAVEELRPLVPPGASLAQLALRWILMFEDVTCTIPGARRPAQVEENVQAAGLPPLSDEVMSGSRAIYDRHFRARLHHRW